MNQKKVGKGLVKGSLWGAGAYATYAAGAGLQKLGIELGREFPIFAGLSLAIIMAGEVVKYTAIIPGLGAAWNGLDVVVGTIENEETA